MKNLLHANSPEIFDVLGFFGFKETDKITSFSLLINSNGITYNYTYWDDDTELQPTYCSIPFNQEVCTAVLELLGLSAENMIELGFSIKANELAEITLKKEVQVESIKRQPLTLSEILTKT